jgi:hypothetical protein
MTICGPWRKELGEFKSLAAGAACPLDARYLGCSPAVCASFNR